jgi:hypothetical protein
VTGENAALLTCQSVTVVDGSTVLGPLGIIMPAPPRPREIIVLLLLLCSLVYFSPDGEPSMVTELSEPDVSPASSVATQLDAAPIALQRHWSETKIVAHAPGWTIFDNLFLYKGTLYVVTNSPHSFPDILQVFSKAHFISIDLDEEIARMPTDEDIQVIDVTEATLLFGLRTKVFEGVTWLVNDPPQFMTHYYHFCAELLFGMWRAYVHLANSSDIGSIPPPSRLLFPHCDNHHWRDYSHLSAFVLHSAFPGMGLQFVDDWRDYAMLARPIKFERVLIADRAAAMTGYNYQRYQRSAGTAFSLPLPPGVGPSEWWMPIRNAVVGLAGIEPEVGDGMLARPVITYISRQAWGRRMLRNSSHDALVQELKRLEGTYGYEINIVTPEDMAPIDQVRLAAKTTIMMGVHGNGLTSLLWMKPSPRSTVMEFFYPQGFAHDYEYTTRALGMRHYGFWDGEYFTSPGLPLPNYPEGFQGKRVPAVFPANTHSRCRK